MQNIKYVYNPEKRDIYFWNGKGVTLEDSSWGHTCVMDIKGKFLDVLGDYSDEMIEIESSPVIGKVIRPRWDKYEQEWRWRRRGCEHEEVIRNGSNERH
jgi:hypothetical protein